MPKTVSFLDLYCERLLSEGLISLQQLLSARRAAAQTGVDFDDILIVSGAISPEALYAQKSFVSGYPGIDLQNTEIDTILVRQYSGSHFRTNRFLPVARQENGRLLIATSRDITPECREEVEGFFGEAVDFAVTTTWDISRVLLRVFADHISRDSSNSLYESNPDLSAKTVLNKPQKVIGLIIVLIILAAVGIAPVVSLVVFLATLAIGFFTSIIYKFYISSVGSQQENMERITDKQVRSLKDEELPVYTVLVPVYHEENVVGQLVENLGRIDYPVEKLEVLILTEEDDQLTRDAIAASNPPAHFKVITVPDGQPRTKPRACNVGLYFATGEFLVIFDAEDRPDPDQLKKAVIAFRNGGNELVCVQAALNYFNDDENFLTRMFTLEYSFWFDYMLPGLEMNNMPIPLGGTSNHFRTKMLDELGGWDAWNVTEDADLGIRASALGYKVGTINSTTMEEANTSVPNFIRQRSRWIKGYIQTTLVHLRHPVKLVQSAGLKQALGFLFLIGGTPACFLAVLPLYFVSFITFVVDPSLLTQFMPAWVLVLCLLNFFVGNALMIHISMVGPFKRRRWGLVLWALLNPIYWLLHSISSYKALWQIIVNPHYWEKTNHGLTKVDETETIILQSEQVEA